MNRPLVVHVIPHLGIGGAEALLAAFLRQPSTQFRYAVIYFKDGSNRLLIEKAGVKCFYLPAGRRIFTPTFWLTFYRLLEQLKPSAIHAWLWSASITGRIMGAMLRVPVISAYHNNIEQNGLLRNLVDRYTCALDSESIAVSEQVALPLGRRSDIATLTVIHNGIESEPVYQAAQRIQAVKLERYPGKFVIGFVGRFVPLKNIPFLLEAVKQITETDRSIILLLVGGGPQENQLRKLVNKLQLNDFVQFIIGQNAQEWYGYFDLFVQPSFKEGISIALLEALSAEIPAIVLNETAEHSVITDGLNGRVVQDFTPQALASSIIELKNSALLKKQFAQNGKRLVQEKFNFHVMHKQYENIYHKWSNR